MPVSKSDPLSFERCERLWLKKRAKADSVRLAANTALLRLDDDTFGVRLYATIIIRVMRSGHYQLSTGGYRTATTRNRIVRFAPVNLHVRAGEWYLNGDVFTDDMVVLPA